MKKTMAIIGWFTLLALLLVASGNHSRSRAEAEIGAAAGIDVIVYDDGAVIESEDHGRNGAGIVEARERRRYRPSIVDIRDAPAVNLMGGGLHLLASDIVGFRGYDSGFKRENQMWLAQNRPEMQSWPYRGSR